MAGNEDLMLELERAMAQDELEQLTDQPLQELREPQELEEPEDLQALQEQQLRTEAQARAQVKEQFVAVRSLYVPTVQLTQPRHAQPAPRGAAPLEPLTRAQEKALNHRIKKERKESAKQHRMVAGQLRSVIRATGLSRDQVAWDALLLRDKMNKALKRPEPDFDLEAVSHLRLNVDVARANAYITTGTIADLSPLLRTQRQLDRLKAFREEDPEGWNAMDLEQQRRCTALLDQAPIYNAYVRTLLATHNLQFSPKEGVSLLAQDCRSQQLREDLETCSMVIQGKQLWAVCPANTARPAPAQRQDPLTREEQKEETKDLKEREQARFREYLIRGWAVNPEEVEHYENVKPVFAKLAPTTPEGVVKMVKSQSIHKLDSKQRRSLADAWAAKLHSTVHEDGGDRRQEFIDGLQQFSHLGFRPEENSAYTPEGAAMELLSFGGFYADALALEEDMRQEPQLAALATTEQLTNLSVARMYYEDLRQVLLSGKFPEGMEDVSLCNSRYRQSLIQRAALPVARFRRPEYCPDDPRLKDARAIAQRYRLPLASALQLLRESGYQPVDLEGVIGAPAPEGILLDGLPLLPQMVIQRDRSEDEARQEAAQLLQELGRSLYMTTPSASRLPALRIHVAGHRPEGMTLGRLMENLSRLASDKDPQYRMDLLRDLIQIGKYNDLKERLWGLPEGDTLEPILRKQLDQMEDIIDLPFMEREMKQQLAELYRSFCTRMDRTYGKLPHQLHVADLFRHFGDRMYRDARCAQDIISLGTLLRAEKLLEPEEARHLADLERMLSNLAQAARLPELTEAQAQDPEADQLLTQLLRTNAPGLKAYPATRDPDADWADDAEEQTLDAFVGGRIPYPQTEGPQLPDAAAYAKGACCRYPELAYNQFDFHSGQ